MHLGIGNSIGKLTGKMPEAAVPAPTLYTTNLIGHWDFTDADQMYLERTSYGTNVSSDGDAIGRVKNKATGTTALGTFLRATSDSERPLYKTGGQNSKTFARFDGSNDHLFGKRHTNQDWGAVTGSTFSTSTVYQNAVSVIFVGKTTNAAASGSEKMISVNGTGSIAASMTIQKTGYGANDLQGFQFDQNSANTNTFYNDSDFGTTVALYSVVFATGTSIIDGVNAGNCISYKNGAIDQDARGTATANEGMVFNTGNMNGFCLAENIHNTFGPMGFNWGGDIYEVLFYNEALSHENRESIETYLNTKYNIY